MRSSLRRAAAGLLVVTSALAPLAATADVDTQLEQLRDVMTVRLPDVPRENIRRSAAPGLFEIHSGHSFGYLTADGRFLVSGDLVDLDTGAKLTDARRNEERVRSVQAGAGEAIVFAPPMGLVKQWVTIFTDVDCHYCKLLHREIGDINRAGIGVRYFFYSKYGAPSEAFDQAQSVWCQFDRAGALNTALLYERLPNGAGDCRNPVKKQYDLAVDMGLRGTPVTILPDGSVMYGFMKADKFVAQVREHPLP